MKNKVNAAVWCMFGALSVLLWLILIAAEATGAMSIGWTAVTLGVVWIPAVMLLVGGCEVLFLLLALRIKRKIREWKNARRIRAQAIHMGIWNVPQALGGKALDMCARENYGIKRKSGETDMELRRRCMEIEAERHMPGYALGKELDRIAHNCGVERKQGESDEALRGRIITKIRGAMTDE